MQDHFIWPCINKSSEIAHIIDQLEEKYASNIDSELTELKITVNLVRSTLVPFLSEPQNEVAFDVCVQGIKQTVDRTRKEVDALAAIIQTSEWEKQKIILYKLDFLLKQKLDQFSSLFPSEGETKGASMIMDPAAREFWKTSFGDKMLLVPWATFFHALEERLDASYERDEEGIKAHLDFTHDGFVTPYEFNTFLEWFGPLKGCIKRLTKPLRGGLLCGFIPAVEATMMLSGKPTGTFLIRFSKTHPGSFAVTFVDSRNKVKHCLLFSVAPAGVTLKQPPQVYASLMDFVKAHGNKLRIPIGTQWSRGIQGTEQLLMGIDKAPLSPASAHRGGRGAAASAPFGIPEGGNGNGNSDPREAEQCIVCMDRKVETVFLECGHLACCKECAKKLQGHPCPICRSRISRFVVIFRT